MKYQSLTAFEKHLLEASPKHFSSVYMIVCPQDYERRKIIEKAAQFLADDDSFVTYCDAANASLEQALEQLNTASLFGGRPIVVFDGIEKFKKPALEQLSAYLSSPASFSYLILGSSKGINDLYQKGKKEMVLLDLSGEKPWERQRRLKEWLMAKAAKEGKPLEPSAAAYLLDEAGLDMAGLDQELFKLMCYAVDKKQISLKDVQLLCAPKDSSTGWQIAEAVVWDGHNSDTPITELSSLLPLMGQIRYQLEAGLQIVELLKKGTPAEEIAKELPQVRQLEKYLALIKKRRASYFKEGLFALYDLELHCKSSSLPVAVLWGHFVSKLHHLRTKPCPRPHFSSFPMC